MKINWPKIESYLQQVIEENENEEVVDIKYIIEVLEEEDLMPTEYDDIFKTYTRLVICYYKLITEALKEERYEICSKLKKVIAYEKKEMEKIVICHFENDLHEQLLSELEATTKEIEQLYLDDDDNIN
jgi:hypothetical protein